MKIREARPSDIEDLASLRRALWPDGELDEHRGELEAHFIGAWMLPTKIFVAVPDRGPLAGFAEISIRPHAEGCASDRVGYLEGWYVEPSRQRQGLGRRLVEAAESWARNNGCTEFASDAEAGNEISAAAHVALGFHEVGLIRCFKKSLSDGPAAAE